MALRFVVYICTRTALKSHMMSYDSVATKTNDETEFMIKRDLPKLKFDLDSVSYWSGAKESYAHPKVIISHPYLGTSTLWFC